MTCAEQLDRIVSSFNEQLKAWEDASEHRANFGFFYYSDGRKYMKVLDIAPMKGLPIEDAKLQEAGKIIQEALDNAVKE